MAYAYLIHGPAFSHNLGHQLPLAVGSFLASHLAMLAPSATKGKSPEGRYLEVGIRTPSTCCCGLGIPATQGTDEDAAFDLRVSAQQGLERRGVHDYDFQALDLGDVHPRDSGAELPEPRFMTDER